jgi:hypothetical protein
MAPAPALLEQLLAAPQLAVLLPPLLHMLCAEPCRRWPGGRAGCCA